MVIGEIILIIFRWILALIGMVGIIGLAPLIVGGFIFLVKSSNEQDSIRKKAYIKKGIIFILLPFVLIIGSLIAYAILNTIKTLLGAGLD